MTLQPRPQLAHKMHRKAIPLAPCRVRSRQGSEFSRQLWVRNAYIVIDALLAPLSYRPCDVDEVEIALRAPKVGRTSATHQGHKGAL